MKVFFCRLISYLLATSLIALPFSSQAALIGTEQVVTQAQAHSDRDRVNAFLARADVQNELQSYGVNPKTAKERVDALTDQEVRQIAGKLDALPAGALTSGETALVVVLVIAAIYVLLQFIYKK